MPSGRYIAFSEFRLDTEERVLSRGGKRVSLPPKAVDLLLLLAQHAGHVVDKETVLNELWPDTFVEESRLASNVSMLRKILTEGRDGKELIETIPKRGYRFIATVQQVDEIPLEDIAQPKTTKPQQRLFTWVFVGAGALALLLVGAVYLYFHRAPALTDRDFVVLADIANTTGDPVFDGTLREGLAAELAQSPFLNLVPKDRMKRTLALMGESPDAPLDPKVARELCLRTGAKAVLEGSITQVGAHYSVLLNADRCTNGESLANTAAQARDKARVLEALDAVATEMRKKLGESLSSVQKYDTPIEQATTPSLEALQAFSLGRRVVDLKGDYAAAVPMFQGAIRLDSNFAMAYAALGTSYYALEESARSGESLKKAYDLRAHVSERERFEIEALYYWFATGDLEKAVGVYERWAQAYPRNDVPPNNLGVLYQELGRNEETLEQARECFRLDPDSGLSYGNLVDSYLHLGRLKEARATAEEALAKGYDSPHLHFYLHRVAFLESDPAGMERQVAWAAGKPGTEELILESQVHAEAYLGHIKRARELMRRTVDSSVRTGDKEAAAVYQLSLAQSEAFLGMPELARPDVRAALALSSTRDTEPNAAIVLALVGSTGEAEKIAGDFAKQFPEDTNISRILVPAIRAAMEIVRKNPAKAIELLASVSPFELGSDDNLTSVYLRGQTLLMLGRGDEATREFQKLLDHRGIYQKNERAAMAQLGLARAFALEHDTERARATYRKFLDLWQTADAEIPLLQQAKKEYAKLL